MRVLRREMKEPPTHCKERKGARNPIRVQLPDVEFIILCFPPGKFANILFSLQELPTVPLPKNREEKLTTRKRMAKILMK